MFLSHDNNLLSHLSLTSLDAVRAYQSSDLIKNHRNHRDILRIITTFQAQSQTLYLKRLWHTHKKDGLKSLLRHHQLRSLSLQESLNYASLRHAGIPTPQVLAVGQDLSLLWERFSFILTAAAPGQPLDEFLRSTPPASPLRKQTLHALAFFIRKLHSASLYSPDLFTRHIFVSPHSPTFTLIDMARLDRSSPHSPRLITRDLAALNITAPLSLVTRTERLRFLHTYDPASILLIPQIRCRVNYLLKRRKYQPFLQ
jgi:tRNA A-37 threonylcarbamoyl transferase component Bud32